MIIPHLIIRQQKKICQQLWLLCLCCLILPLLVQANPSTAKTLAKPDVRSLLKNTVSSSTFKSVGKEQLHFPDMVRRFYTKNGFVPVWTTEQKAATHSRDLLACILEASSHGLNPMYYHALALNRMVNSGDTVLPTYQLTELELLFTDAYLSLGLHYLRGKVDPSKFNSSLHPNKRSFDMVLYLTRALEDKDICHSLELLLPIHPEYEELRDILKRYQALYWEPIPAMPYDFVLTKGNSHFVVPAVRKRLQITGELKKGTITDVFDNELQQAIIDFQKSHGMYYDGRISSATINMMNVSSQHRIQQIIANLERWRWQPDDRGERYIVVNIPDYHLKLFKNEQVDYESKVIVGRDKYPTPSFTDSITYMVFNPYWNLPKSIVKNELWPEVKEDNHYLLDNDIAVFRGGKQVNPLQIDWDNVDINRYYFRQSVNAHNPMGAVKFMFPNRFSVYMHDTPYKDLFNNTRRTNSHGCIRLQNPLQFAEYLLKDQRTTWDAKRIDDVLFTQQENKVSLRKPLPINILYWTVFYNKKGIIQFREDIYQWDIEIFNALNDLPVEMNKYKAEPQ